MSGIRIVFFGLGLLAVAGCFGGCDDDHNYTSPPPTDGVINGYWPCIIAPGDTLTVYGSKLGTTVRGSIGDKDAVVLSKSDARVTLRVPDGVTHGVIALRDDSTLLARKYDDVPVIGTEAIIPEVEPNDDVSGSNATPMDRNREATGFLSSPLENDHFKRDCFHPGSLYQIKVTPPLVPLVYVDGVAVPLNAAGEGSFRPTRNTVLFGLTASVGGYKISIGLLNF